MITIYWTFDIAAIFDVDRSLSLPDDDDGSLHTASLRALSPFTFVHYMYVTYKLHVYISGNTNPKFYELERSVSDISVSLSDHTCHYNRVTTCHAETKPHQNEDRLSKMQGKEGEGEYVIVDVYVVTSAW
jgi:hypothetical protein